MNSEKDNIPELNLKSITLQAIKQHKKNKLKRYFINHKGRSLFMIICVILLIVCAFTNYPINGDIESNTGFSRLMSIFGYISANVFIALLFTILGVETYMSREELKEIEKTSSRIFKDDIKNNINDNVYKSNLLEKIKRIKSKNKLNKSNKYLSKVAIDDPITNDISKTIVKGNNEDVNIDSILELYYELSPSEKIDLYEEINEKKNI